LTSIASMPAYSCDSRDFEEANKSKDSDLALLFCCLFFNLYVPYRPL